MPWRPASPARPVGAARCRRLLRWLTYAAATVTAAVLLFVVGYILVRGVPALTPDLFQWEYTSENVSLLPALASTVIMALLALALAVPVGVGAAIYLVEYARRGSRFVRLVRVTAETLQGIPSIIYGLFGMLFFVTACGWGLSLLSGACTLAIMVLPVIMRTTEEALMAVPDSYREGGFGLGAGRLRTVARCVLPSAVPGILGGVILALGRCVGEVAALLFTAGTVAQIPDFAGQGIFALFDSCRTLAVHMYTLACEGLHVNEAYATSVVLLILVLLLNAAMRVGGTENGSEQEMTSFLKELANETSVTAVAEVPGAAPAPAKMAVEHLNLFYGDFQGLRDINLTFPENQVTALIGPSGCGKSTLLKTLNRMNDLVEGCRVEGSVLLDGADAYRTLDATDLRRRVGMVFQQPNPFPMSIYDNVAFGPRSHGVRAKADLDVIVEESLRAAAIWDELKDRLKKNALGLSGGQQQRLCIARALAVQPEVLLLDESTSALDPISTAKIEELIGQLKERYTVIMVTHNMLQALRISDKTAFFLLGEVVEAGDTDTIFSAPIDPRTADYVAGRFG